MPITGGRTEFVESLVESLRRTAEERPDPADTDDDEPERDTAGETEVLGAGLLGERTRQAQHHFLADEGCDAAQGYLFAKPMPLALCTEHLLAQADRHPMPRTARAGVG